MRHDGLFSICWRRRLAGLVLLLGACDGGAEASADVADTSPEPEVSDGTCAAATAILIGEATNARDLGGLALAGGGEVACGAVYRGGPLARLTEAGCAEFAERGIGTVIDLRMPLERDVAPPAACLFPAAELVLAPMPIPWSVSPSDYLADLHAAEAIVPAFRALGDPAAYPIYFHCTYGRDRTGVLAALVLLVLGASPEVIMDDYRRTAEAGLSITPDSLQAVLDELDSAGGAAAYLESLGISRAELDVLRNAARR